MGIVSTALEGSFWTVIASFPMAMIVAIVYRFPVPLIGYMNGFKTMHLSHVKAVVVAVLFYGVLGGFLILALLGGIGGCIAYKLGDPDCKKIRRLNIGIASLLAFAGAMALSLLDKVIGPW